MRTLIAGTSAALLLTGPLANEAAAVTKYTYRMQVKYDVKGLSDKINKMVIKCRVFPNVRDKKKFKVPVQGKSAWIPVKKNKKGVALVIIKTVYLISKWNCDIYVSVVNSYGSYKMLKSSAIPHLYALKGSVLFIQGKTKFKFGKIGK